MDEDFNSERNNELYDSNFNCSESVNLNIDQDNTLVKTDIEELVLLDFNSDKDTDETTIEDNFEEIQSSKTKEQPSTDEILIPSEVDEKPERSDQLSESQSKIESSKPKGKVDNQASSSTACDVCSKTVYPMEKVLMDNKVYHKQCFKCSKCQKLLSPTVVTKLNGNIFCKPHYLELFKMRGRYEDIDVNKQPKDHVLDSYAYTSSTVSVSNQPGEKTSGNYRITEKKSVSARDLATKFQDLSSSDKDNDRDSPRKPPIDIVMKRRVSDVTKTWGVNPSDTETDMKKYNSNNNYTNDLNFVNQSSRDTVKDLKALYEQNN